MQPKMFKAFTIRNMKLFSAAWCIKLNVSMHRFRKQIKTFYSFTCKQRQTGSPRSVDTHSRPAPQKVLAHTDWSWDKDREYTMFPWCLCIWNEKYGIRSVCASAPDGDLWPPTGEVLNDNGTLPLSLSDRHTHTHTQRQMGSCKTLWMSKIVLIKWIRILMCNRIPFRTN